MSTRDFSKPSKTQLLEQLEKIAVQMQSAGLWADEPPPERAFQSTAPFCFDTMNFEQWLQWVFLPRMKHLLHTGQMPPAGCSIAPLAEHQFTEYQTDTTALLVEITRFDQMALDYFGIEPE
ncbi:MAG TPA: YqcC family protein [Halothiobacillaceae bacterium]|nr:YqcC family protein [Halothiobacillaceae bacterium]